MHWFFFFFSSRRRHTRLQGDWSSDVCSSDLGLWTGRYAAAAGEKLSSCCARCAWPSPRSTRCPPFFASGTRSSPDLQNHRDADGGIPILKLTLMGGAPLTAEKVLRVPHLSRRATDGFFDLCFFAGACVMYACDAGGARQERDPN